ncbi:hypothetical protein BH10BAC3_BH10BAC3_18490 [soil metagenome]
MNNNIFKAGNVLAAFMVANIACTGDKSLRINDPGVINTNLTTLKFSTEEATDWSNLFYRQSGWIGADGIFAVPNNGVDTAVAGSEQETLLLFSDTILGDIVNDSIQPGFVMVHNSVAILKGDEAKKENIVFFWDKKADGKPESTFVPHTPNSRAGDYYWLGDGFVNPALADATYIFGYRVRDTSNASFGFAEVGNTLIKIPKGSKPPFKDQQQMDTPFFLNSTTDTYGSFGACIFVNTKEAGAPRPDGFIYVYGVRGKAKNVMVARVLPTQFETFSAWQFWDGSSWNSDINTVANITDRVSNELSVTPLKDGRYAMVFQIDGIGKSVGLRLSNHPNGPFGPIIKVWDCQEPKIAKNFIVYNAKVHSNLSQPNELLISYNVNSFDFWNDIKKYPNLYRPRFIRVKLL